MSEKAEQSAGPPPSHDFTQMTAHIVSAYVSNNSVPADELPALIASIHSSLGTILNGTAAKPTEETKKRPAVQVKKSVTHDYIVCLEDGKKFRSLKRHLATAYDLTPGQYRHKWGLPADYPMVAPAYAKTRSELAKKIGLGSAAAMSASRARKKAA